MPSVMTVVMVEFFDTVIAAFMTHSGILHSDSKKSAQVNDVRPLNRRSRMIQLHFLISHL